MIEEEKMVAERAVKKKTKKLYTGVNVVSVLLTVLFVVEVGFLLFGTPDQFNKVINMNDYEIIVTYGILSLMLTYSYCALRCAMRAYKGLLNERRLLLTVFIVFVLTYFSRLVITSVFAFYNANYQGVERFYYIEYCVIQAFPILWDVLPLGLYMIYHLKNFRVTTRIVAENATEADP